MHLTKILAGLGYSVMRLLCAQRPCLFESRYAQYGRSIAIESGLCEFVQRCFARTFDSVVATPSCT